MRFSVWAISLKCSKQTPRDAQAQWSIETPDRVMKTQVNTSRNYPTLALTALSLFFPVLILQEFLCDWRSSKVAKKKYQELSSKR